MCVYPRMYVQGYTDGKNYRSNWHTLRKKRQRSELDENTAVEGAYLKIWAQVVISGVCAAAAVVQDP